MGIPFVKGHGTQNDFVLLPDPEGMLHLTEARVRALCDRQRGLGADGVLRVVPTALASPEQAADAEWFMDYRNADGSIAEMCGNGVRVFVRYLVTADLAKPGEFGVATRAGVRRVVSHADGTVTVDMGPATVTGRAAATVSGREFPGVAVDVGNPHLACPVDPGEVPGLDLATPPGYPVERFPDGVNVEFFGRLADDRLRMRVHERGVGETRSCGTGTVAVVAAALHLAGRPSGESTVHVPGGAVLVTVTPDTSTLTGPAELVAQGEIAAEWWSSAGNPTH